MRPNFSLAITLPARRCGDGNCFTGENSTTCPRDCGCPTGTVLYGGNCTAFKYASRTNYSIMEICGNGACKAGVENQSSCCKDCGCPTGQVCSSNKCSNITMVVMPLKTLSTMPTADKYIVVVIDEIIVHDDEDPTGAGELMLFTYGASGDKAQKVNWPLGYWHSVNSGGTIGKRVPVFALKESEMGDSLAVSITAIDNDEMPGWLEAIIDVLLLPIDAILLVTGSIGSSIADMELNLETGVVTSLNDAISGNEMIGTVNKIYNKSQDWGVSNDQYSIRKGGMTVKYSIKRVSVPKNSKLGVKVYNVTLADTGDYFDGEVFLKLRAATNFAEKNLAGIWYRLPDSGTWDLGDNAFIHSGAGELDAAGRFVEYPVLNFEENGPFVFVEVDAWDKDNPGVGDDHDELGLESWVFLYSDFDYAPATTAMTYEGFIEYPGFSDSTTKIFRFVSRGNMKAWLEFSRISG